MEIAKIKRSLAKDDQGLAPENSTMSQYVPFAASVNVLHISRTACYENQENHHDVF